MDLDQALSLAEEAKAQGHLNRFPQACIALADEINRLRKVLNVGAYTQQELAATPTPGEVASDPDPVP